ncbi:MAG: hypothetical protein J5I98_11690, partial [Phaeodactylibacter sp.]|nr:hypothetical protein [Phaeodactylibacter sp.]
MKNTIPKKLIALAICSLCLSGLFAQQSNPWSFVEEESITGNDAQRSLIPSAYRTARLDSEALQDILNEAPMRFSAAARAQPQSLMLPMP